MNDHQVSFEHMETGGEGAPVCAHVLLRCLNLASIGRPDLPWTISGSARAVTTWHNVRTQLVRKDWHDQSFKLVKQSMTGSTAINQIEDFNA